jgi:hypothetical protein
MPPIVTSRHLPLLRLSKCERPAFPAGLNHLSITTCEALKISGRPRLGQYFAKRFCKLLNYCNGWAVPSIVSYYHKMAMRNLVLRATMGCRSRRRSGAFVVTHTKRTTGKMRFAVVGNRVRTWGSADRAARACIATSDN